jgi:hypothetical protein
MRTRKYSDHEYETAEYNVRSSILQGIAETANLHNVQYNEHGNPIVDAIVDAIFQKLMFKFKLWSLIALAERGGVPKPSEDAENESTSKPTNHET